MQEPMKVYLSMLDALSMTFDLPTGKVLTLKRYDVYTTENQEEIDFFSKQKGVALRKLTDSEYRKWYSPSIKERPFCQNTKLTPIDVEEFIWTTEDEIKIIDKLKDKGYVVYKRSKKND